MIHVQSVRERRPDKMFKGNRNFVVGLFVSLAIAAFISFVVWLTGRSGNEDLVRYSVIFSTDVSGPTPPVNSVEAGAPGGLQTL